MARLRAADAQKRAASGYGPDFLEAFARGLRVISAFGHERTHITLSDVARATDLPKPSVRLRSIPSPASASPPATAAPSG